MEVLGSEVTDQRDGLPYIDLKSLKPDPALLELIPGEFALKNRILPVDADGDILTCAVGSVEDVQAADDLSVLIQRPIRVVLADSQVIRDRIEEHFLESMLSQMSGEDGSGSDIEDVTDLADLQKMAGDSAVVQMVNFIFAQAVRDNASDIHIEPYERDVKVRYRIDGLLRDLMRPAKKLLPALISRIKILGEMNIAERRLPQDGRIKLTIAGRSIDVRVSIVPTVFGERAVMRILDKGTALLGLEELGMFPDTLERFRKLISIPYGIILVTGPTGSGKSTTLYASLQEIWSPTTNILTIEDPVEYQVPGIGQVQVRPNIGLTFANGLRSFLRQDPDIIMVGEIRDHETAEIAIHAALTGHLVFSTLHTNDSSGAVTRLLDMGVEPFLAASSLVGVVAQRLIRRNCPNCSEPATFDRDALAAIGISEEEAEKGTFMQGRGCDVCGGTGYKGRQGIYELLIMDETIRHMTVERKSAGDIKNYAIANGNLRTLMGDGKLNVLRGRSTPKEVLRVCQREEL
ncbi:MAG: Flp pilus assembly complex ATPase component TadA [Armatimonadetes bacterium]|nr:Flp pilus assembly complex ATPase component TadA [Armatimonadota bacterium]